MGRPGRCKAGLLVLTLLVLFVPLPASADVIRLRSGESLKGRPLEALSTEATLVIDDAERGAQRKVAWSAVDVRDRDRLWHAWGWVLPTIVAVEGHAVVLRLDDGGTAELRGLLLTAEETPTHYVMRSLGRRLELEKAEVESTRMRHLAPTEVYAPASLVAHVVKHLKPPQVDAAGAPTSGTHYRLARYAESVEAYAEAREHYAAAARDPDIPQNQQALEREKAMAARVDEAAAMDALRDVRLATLGRSFRSARERLDALRAEHEKPSALLAKRMSAAETALHAARAKYFAALARREFAALARGLIEAKLREKKPPTLADATAWVRRELPDAAFEKLTTHVRKRDDLSVAEARACWDARRRLAWSEVGFGAGTFVVTAPKRRPPRRDRKRSGPAPHTREQWWQSATAETRADWVMAFFVLESGLFELGSEKEIACTRCLGTGQEERRAGDIESWAVCRRCAGAGMDRVLRYR